MNIALPRIGENDWIWTQNTAAKCSIEMQFLILSEYNVECKDRVWGIMLNVNLTGSRVNKCKYVCVEVSRLCYVMWYDPLKIWMAPFHGLMSKRNGENRRAPIFISKATLSMHFFTTTWKQIHTQVSENK